MPRWPARRPARVLSVEEPPDAVNGVLLIDKPPGPSSNAVLQRAKRLFGARRAGHTGTLDPLASGLLVIGLGEATKFAAALLDADKAYRARMKLGVRTETGDADGEILASMPANVSRDALLATLDRFRGEIDQTPPRHSAIKHKGRPLYEYARLGEVVPRKPRRVVIHRLDLEEFDGDCAVIAVECSKGTYIRSLAEDIGAALGCGAHLSGLERTAVGPFRLDRALKLEALETLSPEGRRARILPSEALLESWPRLTLKPEAVAKFRHGQAVRVSARENVVAVFDRAGGLLGTGIVDAEGLLRPKRLISTH
jgi:tRNA pseudouridine55 synthase